MSKLFQLKKWLTVPEAADRLSSSFGEKVVEADVLRLALDGHLTLSVDFPNKAKARKRSEKAISVDEHLKSFFDVEVTMRGGERTFEEYVEKAFARGQLPERLRGSDLSEKEIIIDDYGDVETIEGVFDLPMIGAEALDVHHRFMMLSDGPEITLQCLDGAFVTDGSGEHYQLQDRFSDMPSDELPSFERPKPFSERDYYPAGALPDDALWVVRTEALLDLERRILQGEETDSPAGKSQTKPLTNEDRWLDVLGVMAVLLYENTNDPRMRKGENNINMSGIKGAVIGKAQKLGLSAERLENLNKDISAALKILQYPPPEN